MEWTGPLPRLKEKTTGAVWVLLWPSEGAVGRALEKEHLSSSPPSEPTRKVSESQGDTAREVMPTELQPRACQHIHAQQVRGRKRCSRTSLWITFKL